LLAGGYDAVIDAARAAWNALLAEREARLQAEGLVSAARLEIEHLKRNRCLASTFFRG
jgi:hypothetical protein